MWFALVLAGLGMAQTHLPDIQSSVPPKIYGYLTMGIAVVVAVLRYVTTQDLADKNPTAPASDPGTPDGPP